MNIDPVLASIIVAIIVNAPAYFMSRETNRKIKVEREAAQLKAREDARTEESKRAQLEEELTTKVLERADREIEKYRSRVESLEKNLDEASGLIEALRASKRESDQKVLNLEQTLSDRDSKFQAELTTERMARQMLETRLLEAQQRISALEDELDGRDRRIKELEARQNSQAAGFGSK